MSLKSSQKLLVNIFLPGDSENIKIKDYKITESETDEPKMACFIKGTYEGNVYFPKFDLEQYKLAWKEDTERVNFCLYTK